jgi:cytochrome c
MKKAILILSLSIGIAACGSNSSSNNSGDSSTTKQDIVAQNPSAATDTNGAKNGTETTGASKGETLMASLDCNTCHKADMKLVGPSFKDIAAKYSEADLDKLADKVIKGGAGNWGEVPMTPHPAVSKDDAKEMVKFILSHK